MTDPTHPTDWRASHALCGATTRQGGRCRNPPVKGATRCRMHGGSLPQVRRKIEAERRRADALAVLKAEGVEPVADPVAALRDLAGETRVLAAATRQTFAQTAGRDGLEATAGAPIAAMYAKVLDQTGKLLARMAELGITPDRSDALPALRAETVVSAIAEAWRYGHDGHDKNETILHCLEDDYRQETP